MDINNFSWSRLRYWLLVLLVNFILAFLVSEFTLRYIYTPEVLESRMQYNTMVVNESSRVNKIFDGENLRFVPKSQNTMRHHEFLVSTSHDILGYRNPCYNDLHDETNDLIIGDSFVYGVGLPDNLTYGCQLLNKGLSIYTIGIPGASLETYLQTIKKNVNSIKFNFPRVENIYLVIFLGNDFESLVNYRGISFKEKPSILNKLFVKMNDVVVKNSLINKIYTLNALKILLKPIFSPSDKGDYVVNQAGSTFYKKNPSCQSKKQLLL